MLPVNRLFIPILFAAILSTPSYHAFADNTPSPSQNSPTAKATDAPMPPAPFGLTWGDSYDTVKQVLSDKGFNDADPADQTNSLVLFSKKNADGSPGSGVTIDGETIQNLSITFGPKGLSSVMVMYVAPSSDEDALAQFHRIAQKLAAAYGPPGQAVDEVDAPYKSGDEATAVKNHKGTVKDYWYFTPSDTGASSGMVATRISDDPAVSVIYVNQSFVNPSSQSSSDTGGTTKQLPDCPLGLAWGDSMATVQKVLSADGFPLISYKSPDIKNGASFYAKNYSTSHTKGISVNGEVVSIVDVGVGKKGLYAIGFSYAKLPDSKETLAQYHRIAQQITAEYGPTHDSDNTVDAIFNKTGQIPSTNGKIGLQPEYDAWFTGPPFDKVEKSGDIYLSLNFIPEVGLEYYDDTIGPEEIGW